MLNIRGIMCKKTNTKVDSAAPMEKMAKNLPKVSSLLEYFSFQQGWLGVAKVSCILRHRGIQQILAYSWARPAIFVAGKGRGGMFLCLLFLHFNSCSSFFPVPLFHLHYYLFYLFSLSLGDDTK